ncbi:DUF4250 domain-containing protein [Vibrio chagasii]|nr:DUF4250 domain-containing protein [Vibrio chagasii]
MDLSNVKSLDSIILLGIVNEKLRLSATVLKNSLACMKMDIESVVGKLDMLGYQ